MKIYRQKILTNDDFWNPIQKTSFFNDEKRLIVKNITVSSSSIIDTFQIDGWRQGVEIRQQKHFDAGTVKIHAGEKGHVLKEASIGKNAVDDLSHDNVYVDIRTYQDVKEFIKDGQRTHVIIKNIDGNGSIMGVLEPISKKRKLVTAVDSDGILLKQSNVVYGTYGNGNENAKHANDQVVSVHVFDLSKHVIAYHDRKTPELFIDPRSNTNNVVVYSDIINQDSNNNVAMNNAMRLMSGSTDNYVTSKEVSGACGFYYDNNVSVGTDSIAFGGMTY